MLLHFFMAVALQLSERETLGAAILDDFAASSGLTSTAAPRRYLWTDAFAVYTWLGLHERSGEPRFLELARRAIQQVHDVLGPIQGQSGRHPTAGGLRIGKPLPERAPDEPYDPDLEWERDGQYYHYLTKWMHALELAARVSGDKRYHEWGVELGRAAHRAFAYPPGAPQRLYWKMSVDLSRPLVPSMAGACGALPRRGRPHGGLLRGALARLGSRAVRAPTGGRRPGWPPAGT